MVRKHNQMNTPRFGRGIGFGIVVCIVAAFLVWNYTGFEACWRGLRDGMTQQEVLHMLGRPTQTGTGALGAGNQRCPSWTYRRWHGRRFVCYEVDFDFIGPGGSPVVFRTARYDEEWEWPSWVPLIGRAKARA